MEDAVGKFYILEYLEGEWRIANSKKWIGDEKNQHPYTLVESWIVSLLLIFNNKDGFG